MRVFVRPSDGRFGERGSARLMGLPRDVTGAIARLIDDWTPPVIRDQRWFAALFIWPLARGATKTYLDFRERAHGLSRRAYADAYAATAAVMRRPTDLNRACADSILESVREAASVLDVGAGRGWLAERLEPQRRLVAALDIATPRDAPPGPVWIAGEVERLPFADASFDAVVCAHTLEHVLDFEACLAELRRVARRKLVIVCPLQRPARAGLDLHVTFFPYPESFLLRARPGARAHRWATLGGDLFYEEWTSAADAGGA